LLPRIIKVGCVATIQVAIFTDISFADICNQLLDFYDEIERQNAVSAQAAVVATSEQQPACTSSQRADAAPMATLPDLKVQRLSASFLFSVEGMLPFYWVWIAICATRERLHSIRLIIFGYRRSFLPGYDINTIVTILTDSSELIV
jgi:hypothetical protein